MTTSRSEFSFGDRVFAKLKGYSYWPARIELLPDEVSTKSTYKVAFYGSLDWALINKKNIVLYDEKSKEKYGKPKKSAKFNKALNEIETDHKKHANLNKSKQVVHPSDNTIESSAANVLLSADENLAEISEHNNVDIVENSSDNHVAIETEAETEHHPVIDSNDSKEISANQAEKETNFEIETHAEAQIPTHVEKETQTTIEDLSSFSNLGSDEEIRIDNTMALDTSEKFTSSPEKSHEISRISLTDEIKENADPDVDMQTATKSSKKKHKKAPEASTSSKVALQENQAVENTARQTRQTKRKLTESQESVQSSNTPLTPKNQNQNAKPVKRSKKSKFSK